MISTWPSDRIRKVRKAYGESQYIFCQRLGVTPGALQFWEQGKGEPSRPVQIILEMLEEKMLSSNLNDGDTSAAP